MGKMRKTSKKLCVTCKYHFGGSATFICCDYLLRTGERRNCKYGECDKYEKGKGEDEARWDHKDLFATLQ